VRRHIITLSHAISWETTSLVNTLSFQGAKKIIRIEFTITNKEVQTNLEINLFQFMLA